MILCTGCSFTYGEELADLNQAYPIQLGKMMNNTPVINAGIKGASNDYIHRTTMENCLTHKPDMVIVQWTETNRLELHPNLPVNIGPYKSYTGPLQVNIRTDHKFINTYYKEWWDEKHAFMKWIWQVIATQNFLNNNNIPYIMINGFGNQELIKKYNDLPEYNHINTEQFMGWPDEGITEWVYGTPLMPKGHPGPEGHRKVAEKICREIDGNIIPTSVFVLNKYCPAVSPCNSK